MKLSLMVLNGSLNPHSLQHGNFHGRLSSTHLVSRLGAFVLLLTVVKLCQ